jgi:hypothetical protein
VKRNLSFITAAAAVATAVAAVLWLAVPAGAGARPAVSGTEHFQAMTTSATSSTQGVIAYGVFTAAGIDHEGNKVDTFVFPTGSFKVAHKGKATFKVNPKTCLVTGSESATIAISGGTGAYKGISGTGTGQVSILGIAATSSGKCTLKKPPVAYQQIITATATVKL